MTARDDRPTILHVGVHKTGSSAIQLALTRNRATLLADGVLYPLAGCPADPAIAYGQHDLPWHFLGRNVAAGVVERLRAEIAAADPARVVLSSEEFGRLDDAQVRAVAEAIPGRKTVVFYYRRQSDVLQGIYATEVCFNRDLRTIGAFAAALDVELNYLRLARRWAAAVGRENVIARPYRRDLFEDGTVLRDFAAVAGIPLDAATLADRSSPNKSIPSFATLAVQAMWRNGLPDDAVLGAVAAIQRAAFSQSYPHAFLSEAERRAFDARFHDDNRAFLAEFGAGHPDILAPAADRPDTDPAPLPGEVAALCETIALLSRL